MAKKEDQKENLIEILEITDAILKRNPHLAISYRPSKPQEKFHQNVGKYKTTIFRAGNQSGKTFASMADIAMHALSIHPTIPKHLQEPPIKIRVVGLSNLEIADPLWETLKHFIPENHINEIAWTFRNPPTPKKIRMKNKSSIEFLSQEMGAERFQGWAGHRVHLDEEGRYEVYQECVRGLLNKSGLLTMSFTPTKGQRWVRDLERDLNTQVITATPYDNPANSKEDVENWANSLSEENREVRIKGGFAKTVGLVYGNLNERVHGCMIEGDDLVDMSGEPICKWPLTGAYPRYGGFDFGWTNPFVYLHAIKVSDYLIFVACIYKRRLTISTQAQWVKSIWDWDIKPKVIFADHERQEREEMRNKGIATKPAKKEIIRGIESVRDWLHVQENERPRAYFLANTPTIVEGENFSCREIFEEGELYSYPDVTEVRDSKDKPIDKHNHAMDTLRYVIMGIPDGSGKPPDLRKRSKTFPRSMREDKKGRRKPKGGSVRSMRE